MKRRNLLPKAASILTAVAAAGLAMPSSAHAAPAPTARPALHAGASSRCEAWQVVSADWLKVHVSASASSAAVGQIPRLSNFFACSTKQVGKVTWLDGYGYNGSVKLTGWVDSDYMASY